MGFLGPESGFRVAPNWLKIGKITMKSQFADMTSLPKFFDLVLFFLSSLVTGPSFMSILSLVLELRQFFFKGLTRNPEIGNTPVWFLSNIWRLDQGRDTKLGANVFNEILLNAAKFQGYSLYRFWVIKGKPAGGRREITPAPPRLNRRSYWL